MMRSLRQLTVMISRDLTGRASWTGHEDARPVGSRLTINAARIAVLCLALCATGCIMGRQNPAATQPATLLPDDSTRSPYWLEYPAVDSVSSPSYDALWAAARRAARACSFTVDRVDYRDGSMTTKPLVSKQFFEVWKGDVVDGHDLLQSSLGTMRRIVFFQISHGDDGGYILTPKVVVERYSAAERRITSVAQYLNIFSYEHGLVGEVTDEGQLVPIEYWYSVGRDPHLEQHLVDLMRGYLNK
jgi:hypothetical protein